MRLEPSEDHSSAAVARRLAQRDQEFRDGVEIVALDPSARYAAAVREALPAAGVAVDHFHLVALANQPLPRSASGSPANSSGAAAARWRVIKVEDWAEMISGVQVAGDRSRGWAGNSSIA